MGAVKDIDGWCPDPVLQIIDRKRDVLGVGFVKHPDLAIGGRPRHPMSIVVEQHALILHRKCNMKNEDYHAEQ